MNNELDVQETIDEEFLQADDVPGDGSGLSRREFVQLLGAGLLLTVAGDVALAQRGRPGGFGGGGPTNVAARIHLGNDGAISAMAGKVELGQGARAELTQAVAEELRVAADQIRLILADTAAVPNDGVTAGSGTTPRTVPAMRKAAAAAREMLVGLACKRWQVERNAVEVKDGVITDAATKKTLSYADLAKTEDLAKTFAQTAPADVALTPVKEWKVLGTSLPRPNRRDVVTGAHRYPSDIVRPGMLYGKVLRAPSYGATLTAVDLEPAKAMEGVVVVRDGAFVGCAAPTLFRATQALAAIAKTATWQTVPQPSSKDLFSHLKEHAQAGRGGAGRSRVSVEVAADEAAAGAGKVLNQSYEVAYIQHTPMETRAGVAEWSDGKLTVWTGTANPFGVRGELANTFQVPAERVRVIVPDLGCAFGGKHQGEAGIEAARLAKAAGKPVAVHWTREEEFTWAYFRPAGLIELRGEVDAKGELLAWEHVNINSGGSAIDSPYDIPKKSARSVSSNSPLRQGSYRALAATANNFAREAFMDELAHAAGADPLAFRLAHLKNARLRAVLETAAAKFGWAERNKNRAANVGLGLACGTEKGSFVAACVEVAVDRQDRKIQVRRICQVFECGAILNPANLLSQVQGCILMGLGGALSEEIRFENGKILNAALSRYEVPRFKDVPELDIHLLNRPDLEPAGGGETPIIAVAPAVANAVFAATGVRVRSMPIRLKS
jgi:isoquinoline 1-oxidoreductase subunit beta